MIKNLERKGEGDTSTDQFTPKKNMQIRINKNDLATAVTICRLMQNI